MRKTRIAAAWLLTAVILLSAGCSDWDEELEMMDDAGYCEEDACYEDSCDEDYYDEDYCYGDSCDDEYGYDQCYSDDYYDECGDYSDYGDYDQDDYCYGDQCGAYDGYDDGDYFGSYGSYDGDYGYTGKFTLGSSGALEGRIAVVTILMDDADTSWNLDNKKDYETYGYIYNDLEIASDWISKSCAKYGRDVEFIWDWEAHPELFYDLSMRRSAQNEGGYLYDDLVNVIRNNIDSDDIKSKNDADGIIYMACINSPNSNHTTSSTLISERSNPANEEICVMMMHTEGTMEAPACFAHEMLHAFGAADLYMAGMYGITNDLVRDLEASRLNDIMLTCEDPKTGYYVYDRITNELTDITAYYTGLTDECDTVREWGLEQSDYEYMKKRKK